MNMDSEQLEVCWDGLGWKDADLRAACGRGALLPPRRERSSMENTEGLGSQIESAERTRMGTQRRYTPEERAEVRRVAKETGLPLTHIARRFGIPLTTVKAIVLGRVARDARAR